MRYLIVLVGSLLALASQSRAAAVETVEVAIDRGLLVVEWNEQVTAYEITAQIPANCPATKVAIQRSASILTVHHSGLPCNQQTRFVLRLSKSRNANIKLADGTIETPNLAAIVPSVQQLHASVNSGRVASSLNFLVPVPSHDYTSMAVNWAGGPSTGFCVDLDMKAGRIEL